MHFSLSKVLSLAVLATSVAAIPAADWNGGSTTTVTVTAPSTTTTVTQGQCSTGDQQCCQSVQSASSADAALLSIIAGLLGLNVSNLTGLIGLTCVPLLGGGCQSQAVCCTDNAAGGLVSVGCIPLQL